MAEIPTPYIRKFKIIERTAHTHNYAATRKDDQTKFSGASVNPGKVIPKAERQQRAQTDVKSSEDQEDSAGSAQLAPDNPAKDDYSFGAAAAKVKKSVVRGLRRAPYMLGFLDYYTRRRSGFERNLNVQSGAECRPKSGPQKLRSLLTVTVALVFVFGSLYTLLEYLLLVTRVSAVQNPSTLYIPVDTTVTISMCQQNLSSLYVSSLDWTSTVTTISTLTQISTSCITISPAMTPAAVVSSAGGPTYFYVVNSAGSTSWLNGVSPSGNVSLTKSITTIPVFPIVTLTEPMLTTQSIASSTRTITAPPFTSTTYSFMPDISSLTTSTSTSYTTRYLERISSSNKLHVSRPLFQGVGSGGWNTSISSSLPLSTVMGTTMTNTASPTTEIIYSRLSDPTTSTLTWFSTTSLAVTLEAVDATNPAYQETFKTTVTALPMVITQSFLRPPLSHDAAVSAEPSFSAAATVTTLANTNSIGLLAVSATPDNLNSYSNANGPSEQLPVSSNATDNHSLYDDPGDQLSATNSLPISSSSSGPLRVSQQSSRSLASQPSALIGFSTDPSSSYVGTFAITMPNVSKKIEEPLPTQAPTIMTTSWSDIGLPTFYSSLVGPPAVSTTSMQISGSSSASVSSLQMGSSNISSYSFVANSSGALPIQSGQISGSSSSVLSSFRKSTSVGGFYTTYSLIKSNSSSVSSSRATSILSLPSSHASARIISTSHGGLYPAQNRTFTGSSARTSRSVIEGSSWSSFSTGQSSGISTVTTKTSSGLFPPPSTTATSADGCGEHGNFVISFDDLPNFIPNNERNTTITQAPPIENPYHHLTFSDGYVYAPSPSIPYKPASSPHLAVFLASASGLKTLFTPRDYIQPGEVADGPRGEDSAFWFDAFDAYLGCDNQGSLPCVMSITGYTWNAAADAEVQTYFHNATIPTCKRNLGCSLQRVTLPRVFRSLTGLQIRAFVGKAERMFFIDDLALHWSNNSCAAGLERQRSR